ncbi:MAG: peptidoglycan D,D-transpeptidase FtsI family protein, partial [Planctomycetota bacterium]
MASPAQANVDGEDPPSRRIWTLRVAVLAAALITFGLTSRLVAIQVIHHGEYLTLRDGQSRVLIPNLPERGRLLDRRGKELAVSRSRVKSLFAVPPQIHNPKALAGVLGELLRTDPKGILEAFGKNERKFVWVKRMLADSEVRAVEELKAEGLGFRDEPKRFYPHGKLASHALGFVGVDHKGLEGAEAAFERLLIGRPGYTWFARDALKRLIALPGHRNRAPVNGKDVWLTLDSALQYIVEEEIEQALLDWNPKSAIVIMLDTETGGVLALAVRPTFDPNRYGNSPGGARRNRALTDPYEPGSIFKPLTLAMAYQEKAVQPTDRFDCGLGDWKFRDGRHKRILHDYHPYGMLTAEEVLVKSSNIGITKIALNMSDTTLIAYIKAFGIGTPTGIELRGEAKGWVAPKGWSFYTRTSVPWGQEVAMTPLQILAAINTIANDGVWVKPTVFLRATASDGSIEVPIAEPTGRRVISPEAARLVRRAMHRVVQEGTGRNARIKDYAIGGKTGTKCKMKKDGTYDMERSVTSFVCFAPASKPR